MTPLPRRVVIVDPSTAPTGALRAACNIARSAGDMGAQTVLVLASTARVDDVDLTMFARVVRVPMRQIRRSAIDLALYLPTLAAATLRLRRLLREEDVLIINDIYLLHGWMLRRVGFEGRIATWVRIDPQSFPSRLRRLWTGAMRASSDTVIAVSDFIAGRLRDADVPATIVYDPVDLTPDQVQPATAPRPVSTIVQIANFTRGKGQGDAIAAFARIAADFPATRLVLYGGVLQLQRNRNYLAELQRQAAATGAGDRIIFRGFVRDVRPVLANADVALVLSHRESFSLACLEASQAGLPVIATRCGGPQEIITDGETGFLCDVGDVTAIAAAMTRLLIDPPAAARMGSKGADLVQKRFSRGSFTAALETVLFPGR